MHKVIAKLPGMRKAQEFVVYPRDNDLAPVIVQSDKSIGQFDPHTGEGVLNRKGTQRKYFVHLSKELGAEPFTFPADFVAKCVENEPLAGDEIGAGISVG